MAGMPSLPGPPDLTSEKSIEVRLKSVFGHSFDQRFGFASALAFASTKHKAALRHAVVFPNLNAPDMGS